VDELRRQFPFLKSGALYFDTAATAQKPQRVIDRIDRFYSKQYGTVHRALYTQAAEATAAYTAVRQQAAQFLGASSSDEIIFVKGTTEAINLVASSWGATHLKVGDEILLPEIEHHANIVPWQLLAKKNGVILRPIPVTDQGELNLKAFHQMLSPCTKLVTLAHVSNVLGTEHPIAEIVAAAHAVGAKVLLDGAQSAGHQPIDLQKLDVDFFACSGHKLYGPTGVGLLYGKKELLESMPPYQGGGDMIDRVSWEETSFQPPPLRFEAGTPMIAEVIALGETLSFLTEVGLTQIQQHEQALLAYAEKQMRDLPGLTILGSAPKKGPIISFTIEGVHPMDLALLLDARKIALRTGHLCAQPALRRFGLTTVSRASFGIYNNVHEVDQLVEALDSSLHILVGG